MHTADDEPRRSQTEFVQLAATGNLAAGKSVKPRAKYARVKLKPSPFALPKD